MESRPNLNQMHHVICSITVEDFAGKFRYVEIPKWTQMDPNEPKWTQMEPKWTQMEIKSTQMEIKSTQMEIKWKYKYFLLT